MFPSPRPLDLRSRRPSILVAMFLPLVLAGSLAACGKSSSTTSATTTTTVAKSSATTVAGAAASGSTDACPPAEGTATRTTTFTSAPPMCIDATKTYTATFDTTAGSFTVKLDPKTAPIATNSFVFLARNHYYDGVTFHRIIPGFVIQGGDANGTPPGTGGPGYKFADELPSSAAVYQPGTFAMANSGPNTNGSQFFIVLATGKLQPNYTVFGAVTEGFDTTVQAIAATGSASGTPNPVTTIKTVTITET